MLNLRHSVLIFVILLLNNLYAANLNIAMTLPPYVDVFSNSEVFHRVKLHILQDSTILVGYGLPNNIVRLLHLTSGFKFMWVSHYNIPYTDTSKTPYVYCIQDDHTGSETYGLIGGAMNDDKGFILKVKVSDGSFVQQNIAVHDTVHAIVVTSSTLYHLGGINSDVVYLINMNPNTLAIQRSVECLHPPETIYDMKPLNGDFYVVGYDNSYEVWAGTVKSSTGLIGTWEFTYTVKNYAYQIYYHTATNKYIIMSTQNSNQGVYRLNSDFNVNSQKLLASGTETFQWMAMTPNENYLAIFGKSTTNSLVLRIITPSSYTPYTLLNTISEPNIEIMNAEANGNTGFIILGRHTVTNKILIAKIDMVAPTSCTLPAVNYYNIGCLTPTSTNCHPMCNGQCLIAQDINACYNDLGSIPVFNTASCPANQAYSLKYGTCKPVIFTSCDSYCHGECFGSNDHSQCVTRCNLLTYYDYSTYTCQNCFVPCSECYTATTCDNCVYHNYLFPPGTATQCLSSCPDEYYENESPVPNCSTCTSNCLKCTTGTDCTQCKPGFYLDTVSALVQKCLSPNCRDGYFANTNTMTCDICLEGTYNNALAGSYTACLSCAKGYYANVKGLANCIACDYGSIAAAIGSTSCVPCNPGYYNNLLGQDKCIACAAGKENSKTGSKVEADCTQCNPGYYSGSSATVTCTKCAKGTYSEIYGATSCTNCDPGYYNANEGSSSRFACLKCGTGYYNPNPGKDACIICSKGTANNNQGSILASACVQCGAGYYADVDGLANCKQCPPGTATNSLGTITCGNCQKGYYSQNYGSSVCDKCPKGSYNPDEGKSACTLCLKGTANPIEGSIVSTDCVTCLPGTFSTADGSPQCTACSAGTANYKTGSYNSADCVACSQGYYSDSAGMDYCTACPKGTKNPNTGSSSFSACVNCPKGSYNPDTGKGSCILCIKGSANNNLGSFTSTDCVTCLPGSYADSDGMAQCTKCLPGTENYKTGSFDPADCTSCLAGYYSSSSGTDYCTACPKGTKNPNIGSSSLSACVSCPKGTYNPNTGKGSCILCTKGSANNNLGSFDPTDCLTCLAGSYADSDGMAQCTKCLPGTENYKTGSFDPADCTLCLPGYFSSSSGTDYCTACPKGTKNPNTGSSSISDCVSCPKGSYNPNTGKGSCILCIKGSANNNIGSYNPTDCVTCPVGTFAASDGMAQCNTCNPGYENSKTGSFDPADCTQCKAGYYSVSPGTEFCTPCQKGTYNKNIGSIANSDCKNCPKGSFNPSLGQSDCLLCLKGTYNNNEGSFLATDCSQCLPGTYSSSDGSATCTNCLQGYENPNTGSDDISYCTKCLPGFYASNAGTPSCTPCPHGTYNVNTGSILNTDCIDCPLGTYNENTGQKECILCSKGYANNNKGSYQHTDCQACSPGHYAENDGQALCDECSIGKAYPNYGSFDKNDCTDCAKGKYNDLLGQGTCKLCPKGTSYDFTGSTTISNCATCIKGSYAENDGQNKCDLCLAGTASNVLGSFSKSDCVDCNKGYYSPNDGETSCTICKKGTYQDNIKQSTCIQCGLGYYGPNEGATDSSQCLVCAKGSYSELLGQEICVLCLEGYYNPNENSKSSSSCLPCDKGEFAPSPGTDNCQICPPGTYADTLSSTSCTDCPIGTYSGISKATSLTDCILCPPSTYNNLKKRTDLADCKPCALGTFNLLYGQSKCTDCLEHCKICTSTTTCDECFDTYFWKPDTFNDICIPDCGIGWYGKNKRCSQCDPLCYTCSDGTSDDCIICKLSYKGKCVSACPSHWTNIDGECRECDSSCGECEKTLYYCTSCFSGTYFFNNKCVVSCPPGTYTQQSTKSCVVCPYPCNTCSAPSNCLSCSTPLFLNAIIHSCVDSSLCPDRTYGDQNYHQCLSCSPACTSCNGPNPENCIECDYANGYTRIGNACKALICSENQYVYQDYFTKKIYCADCSDRCNKCVGSGNKMCIGCNIGFQEIKKNDKVIYQDKIYAPVTCGTCEELNVGYKTSPKDKSKCVEICGDGIHLGQFECDDGNTVSGDGCSSDCKIESGYKCHLVKEGGPDICENVVPPEANIFVTKTNQVQVSFSEPVRFIEKNIQTMLKIQITVKDKPIQCNVVITSPQELPTDQYQSIIWLTLQPQCQLSGSELITVTFLQQSMIVDKNNNPLFNQKLSKSVSKYKYSSEVEKIVVKGSGILFAGASIFTFFLTLGIIMFQSAAVSSFWIFVDLVQMVSYLPVLNCVLPTNYEDFLNNYLTIGQIAFPFDILPDFIPNPKKLIKDFITKPLSDQFKNAGFDSISFIYNFSDQIFSWLMLLLVYIILNILCKIFPKTKWKYIHKWRESYQYCLLFRVIIECYLQMCFCSFLNIYNMGMKSIQEKMSMFGAAFAAYLCIGFLVVSLILLSQPTKVLEDKQFQKKFGTLVEEVEIDDIWKRSYYPFFMVRRAIYAMLIVFLLDYPVIQLVVMIIVVVLPMLFYIMTFLPFKDKVSNFLSFYNEAYLFFTMSVLALGNSISMSDQTKKTIGWVLISFIILSLASIWIIMLPPVVKSIFSQIRNFCKKKNPNQVYDIRAKPKKTNKTKKISNLKKVLPFTKRESTINFSRQDSVINKTNPDLEKKSTIHITQENDS